MSKLQLCDHFGCSICPNAVCDLWGIQLVGFNNQISIFALQFALVGAVGGMP